MSSLSHAVGPLGRISLVRLGRRLSYLTLAYNSLEGVAAMVAGTLAGSVALVGFGIDSGIEVVSTLAALWRLSADVDLVRRDRAERITVRIIGTCFLLLAGYLAFDATQMLRTHAAPEKTVPGIVIAALSVVVMPLLSRAKRRVAIGLGSRSLAADATQTDYCAYLSAIVLTGLLLNTLLGWWWTDSVAALVMIPLILREGIGGLRGRPSCDDCGLSAETIIPR